MKTREELLRGAVGKLRPENSLREKVLSGEGRGKPRRPAVRRLSLVGAACMAVLAVAILLPSLLNAPLEPMEGAGAADTPSLSIGGDAAQDTGEDASWLLLGVANEGGYLDAVAVVAADPLSERVSCLFVSGSCAVETQEAGTVPLGELCRLGGAELFETAVEQTLDISVDGAVVVTYDALAGYIDGEGGASILLLENEADYLNVCNQTLRGVETAYTEGLWGLDGQEAVWLLQFSAEGENQLTSRSGRRVALAESLWEQADPEETPARVAELLAGAQSSTLAELPDEETIAARLAYSFDCTAVPDDPMSVETGWDAEGRELTSFDLTALRERVKDFFLSEEMEDMLSSTYDSSYVSAFGGAGLTPQEQAVFEAFGQLYGGFAPGELPVTLPFVRLIDWEAPDEDGYETVLAACFLQSYESDRGLLNRAGSELTFARFRFCGEEDGYRCASIDGVLTSSMGDFDSYDGYVELTDGDRELAAQLYALRLEDGSGELREEAAAALANCREQYGLEGAILGYEWDNAMMTTLYPPIVDTLAVPEETTLEVEAAEGWRFFPDNGEELLAYFSRETYQYIGRYQFFGEPDGVRFVLTAPDGTVLELLVSGDGFLVAGDGYVYELPQFLSGDFEILLSEAYQRALESGEIEGEFQP